MESVIWAFSELHRKGLTYRGFRVLPYCWNDETPLSNHELRMDDDVYKMRQDPAVTVGFPVTTEGIFHGAKLLIWTTTPWTSTAVRRASPTWPSGPPPRTTAGTTCRTASTPSRSWTGTT